MSFYKIADFDKFRVIRNSNNLNCLIMSLVKFKRRFPLIEGGLPKWFETDNWFEDEFFKTAKNIPAMNVKEDDTTYNIELAIPGFSKKEIEISLENDILLVTAEKKEEEVTEDEGYTRKEFSYNAFERRIPLPLNVNQDEEVKASYTNGVLNLLLTKVPQLQELPKKKIAIK